jgi:hypothetical protein
MGSGLPKGVKNGSSFRDSKVQRFKVERFQVSRLKT